MVTNPQERKKSRVYSLLGPRLSVTTLEGLTIDGVLLKQYLSSGYSGDVYMGVLTEPAMGLAANEPVAVKFYKNDVLEDSVQLERVRREADFGRSVTHPNLMKIYDLFETNVAGMKILYLVMEYLVGNSLADFLDRMRRTRERLTLYEASALGAAIFRGIEAIHATDPPHIHRDIKPQNIFVTNQGEIKIMDFGLIKPTRDKAVSFDQEFLGTIRYAAPEILFEGECDHHADFYSGGAVLYELFYGKPIFDGIQRTGPLVVAISENRITFSEFSEDVQRFITECAIMRLLRKDRRDRISTASEVIDVLVNGPNSKFARELLRKRLTAVFETMGLKVNADLVEHAIVLLKREEAERVLLYEDGRPIIERNELLGLLDPLDLALGFGDMQEQYWERLGSQQKYYYEPEEIFAKRYGILSQEARRQLLDRLRQHIEDNVDDPRWYFDKRPLEIATRIETDPVLLELAKESLNELDHALEDAAESERWQNRGI